MPRALLLLLLLAAGCDDDSYAVSLRCEVFLQDLSPVEASPGDTVTLTGTPFTNLWDTSVYVAGVRAELTEVDRESCETCDECREEQDCTDCSDCDACDVTCEQTCSETASFVVPALPAGAADVLLFNVHGESQPLSLLVLGVADSGQDSATETGSAETGSTETGSTETGSAETGDSATP